MILSDLGIKRSRIKDMKSELSQIQDQFHTVPSMFTVAKIAFGATIWHTWREHNNRIFEVINWQFGTDKLFSTILWVTFV